MKQPRVKTRNLRESCVLEAMAIIEEAGIEELSLREVERREPDEQCKGHSTVRRRRSGKTPQGRTRRASMSFLPSGPRRSEVIFVVILSHS
jgi:hypothetical protein